MSEDLTKKLPKTDSEKLNEILTTIHNLEGRFDNFETRVQQVEQTLEQRLHDTRPIWHKVVADIAQLQAGQDRLEEGQKILREKMCELNSGVRTINRDQIVSNDVLRRLQMDLHSIDERLYTLEVRNRQNSST